ncbi:MAG TPA: cupredoxin domain-containing protein [Caulobacteraceae bacterium]|nr:cupredoxin domain-containing protein [Caulobacteraceae bacterium]
MPAAAQRFSAQPFAAIAALALVVAAAPAPGHWGGAAHAAAERMVNVKIANFAFNPGVTTVSVGTTVMWTNNDDDAHSVVADNKAFRSSPMDTGDSYKFTFTTPGTFAYHCGLHPQMVGKVIVTR